MASKLTLLDPKSIILIVPVVKDSNGVAVSKGTAVEVQLGDFLAYIAAAGTGVQSVVAGAGITVDSTDPKHPVVAAA